jgi:hypothetical protein
MWLEELDDNDRKKVLGRFSEEILQQVQNLTRRKKIGVDPDLLMGEDYRDIVNRFGCNALSVHLFLYTWRSVNWRAHEGEEHPDDSGVVRVNHYSKALNPTKSVRWRRALADAGFRSADEKLRNAWDYGHNVGMDVGGHHAAKLAGGACGELVQMPNRDFHFFLSMMPWIRAGFWPCGWDDDKECLIVF